MLFFLLASAFFLYGALAWRTREAEAPLKVAIGVWPGSETLVYGREIGRLNRHEVQLVEMAWSSAAKVAFANRVVDAAVLSLDEVSRLRDSYHDVRVVLVLDFSRGADGIVVRPPLSSLSELKGRRVGVERQSVGMCLLSQGLKSGGIDIKDVQLVPLNAAEMEAAYRDGELDVLVAGEPWLTRLREEGAAVVYDSSNIPGELCRVLAVRADVLERRREEVEKLVRLHLDLCPVLAEVPDTAAMEVVRRRLGVSFPALKRALSQVDQLDLAANLDLLAGPDPKLEKVSQRLTALLMKDGLVLRAPAPLPWIDASIVEELE